jgi:hypothetical protein
MEPKPKKVNFQIVGKNDAAWSVLNKALKWHEELRHAEVGLAWRKALKADVDGHIVLGRCVKISDLHREFISFDFVIVLNKEYWDDFDDEQRLALMDHELCHASFSLDRLGEPKEDEKGRQVWRVRKHDIEEFREVVEASRLLQIGPGRICEGSQATIQESPFRRGQDHGFGQNSMKILRLKPIAHDWTKAIALRAYLEAKKARN